jgi:hypothetical protein
VRVCHAHNLQGSHKNVQDTLIALWMIEDQVHASRQQIARQACTDGCQQSVEIDSSQGQPRSVISKGDVERGPNVDRGAAAALNHVKLKVCTSGCKTDQVAEIAIVQRRPDRGLLLQILNGVLQRMRRALLLPLGQQPELIAVAQLPIWPQTSPLADFRVIKESESASSRWTFKPMREAGGSSLSSLMSTAITLLWTAMAVKGSPPSSGVSNMILLRVTDRLPNAG